MNFSERNTELDELLWRMEKRQRDKQFRIMQIACNLNEARHDMLAFVSSFSTNVSRFIEKDGDHAFCALVLKFCFGF